MVSVACGHFVVCIGCAAQLELCPICRAVTAWIKVYH
jgi:hypothetical protein